LFNQKLLEFLKQARIPFFYSVKFVIVCGLINRNLDEVTEIGVDKISEFRGPKCPTLKS
jgi:hypothetical protein